MNGSIGSASEEETCFVMTAEVEDAPLVMTTQEELEPIVMTAEQDKCTDDDTNARAKPELLEYVLVPNNSGAITEEISNQVKRNIRSGGFSQPSQVLNPSQLTTAATAEQAVEQTSNQVINLEG